MIKLNDLAWPAALFFALLYWRQRNALGSIYDRVLFPMLYQCYMEGQFSGLEAVQVYTLLHRHGYPVPLAIAPTR